MSFFLYWKDYKENIDIVYCLYPSIEFDMKPTFLVEVHVNKAFE